MNQFDWEEFYNFAKEIFKKRSEVNYRNTISRAYYAAFNISKHYAIKNGLILTKNTSSSSHKEVHQHFSNNPSTLEISEKLKRLRDNRNAADYDDKIDNCKKIAEQSLLEAKYIIYECKR